MPSLEHPRQEREISRSALLGGLFYYRVRMNGNHQNKRVFAVVVSWNLKERTEQCLKALSEEKDLSGIILVDNGSKDGTVSSVREKFPTVEIICNDENLGYAVGNNIGIRKAMEKGAEYVLLINSDAAPGEGAVHALIKAAEEENAGAVGGKPVKMDSPDILDGGWGVINWRNMASRLEGENKKDGAKFSMRREVDYPLGMALLLRTQALREVGLFDESYFAYHEEMELCYRLNLGGWKVIFEPAKFLHGGSESIKRAGACLGREYLLARNSVRFVMKYGNTFQKTKFWLFVAGASLLKLFPELLRGRIKEHLARIHGWWDGLQGKGLSRSTMQKYKLL